MDNNKTRSEAFMRIELQERISQLEELAADQRRRLFNARVEAVQARRQLERDAAITGIDCDDVESQVNAIAARGMDAEKTRVYYAHLGVSDALHEIETAFDKEAFDAIGLRDSMAALIEHLRCVEHAMRPIENTAEE